MKALDMAALALVIIGGLNWLLVGLFEFDLVASIFGSQEDIGAKIVYILVGIAALYSLKFFGHINDHYAVPDRTDRGPGPGTGTGVGSGTAAGTGTGAATGTGTATGTKEDGPGRDTDDATEGSTKNKTVGDGDDTRPADAKEVKHETDRP